jgi:hypothetical protein
VLNVVHGLPAHVLLVHIVVVLVPLGGLFTVLSAVWPAARRKLGFITPLTCVIALVFVPITTHAGRWYQHYLEQQAGRPIPPIDHHAALGANLVWFVIALVATSIAGYALGRVQDQPRPAGDRAPLLYSIALAYSVGAAAIVASALAVWWLYRVGDSGAYAVYGGSIHS